MHGKLYKISEESSSGPDVKVYVPKYLLFFI